jgi:hypothetical protein
MDIDLMLGSFELPSDHPNWEAALLAKLSQTPAIGVAFQEQARFSGPEPGRSAVILPFARPAAT